MTATATTPKKTYSYTGAGDYNYDFVIYENTDLTVTHTDTLGAVATLVLTTDYTVTIDVDGTGKITTTYSPTDGTLEIRRILPLTQPNDLVNNDPLDVEILEEMADRQVYILQQQQLFVDDGRTLPEWKGDWVTAASYLVNDMVRDTSTKNQYICIVPHTAGTFATDLAAGKWVLYMYLVDVEAAKTATAADAVSTAADAVSTAADAVSTAADAVSTDADATAAAASAAAAAASAASASPGTIEGVNEQTGTTYDFVSGDVGKVVDGNNAAAQTFTMGTGILAVNELLYVRQKGAGQVTVAASGVTFQYPATFTPKTAEQYAMITILCVATNIFSISGTMDYA